MEELRLRQWERGTFELREARFWKRGASSEGRTHSAVQVKWLAATAGKSLALTAPPAPGEERIYCLLAEEPTPGIEVRVESGHKLFDHTSTGLLKEAGQRMRRRGLGKCHTKAASSLRIEGGAKYHDVGYRDGVRRLPEPE